MKTFKAVLSEVAEPKSPEEKAFKDQHKIDVFDPLNIGNQVKPKTSKKRRNADYGDEEDEKAYDQAYNESTLAEKAYSVAQQRLMAIALGIKKGDLDPKDYSDEAQELAKSMSRKDLEDFARTKHKGLPMKVTEDAYEENDMIMRQLMFIVYAAEEIVDFLGNNDYDPEEWWQNKMAIAHNYIKTLHAYVEGEKRMMSTMAYDDDPMYESLQEALKQGNLKLKDGTTVRLSRQDAELLNKMFDELNPSNRKEMEKVMMLDKSGFEEILGFAREAL